MANAFDAAIDADVMTVVKQYCGSEVVVLDTGDSYVLARRQQPVDLALRCALQLYADMQVDVKVLPLGVPRVTPEEFEDVRGVMGDVFHPTRAQPLGPALVQLLEQDIVKVLEYRAVRERWAASRKNNDDMPTTKPAADAAAQPRPQFDDLSAQHVFFSRAHDMALVWTGSINVAQEVCQRFPDFSIVQHFHNRPAGNTHNVDEWAVLPSTRPDNGKHVAHNVSDGMLKQLFHLKPYTLEELKAKVSAYALLHCNQGVAVSANRLHNEQERVADRMNTMYVLSNDEAHRVRASELYEQITLGVSAHVHDAAAFRRRLPGYLLGLGLTKKRYSDGYYYFGVEPRATSKALSQDAAEQRLAELIKQREADKPVVLEEYNYACPTQDASNQQLAKLVQQRAAGTDTGA